MAENKYSYEQVEAHLESLGLLKFSRLDEIKSDNIESFLRAFFKENRERQTINEKGEVTCRAYARRTIGDIYRIAKTYRPETRLEEIQDGLLNLCEKRAVGGLICPDINKRVWRSDYDVFMCKPLDEFGFDYSEKLSTRNVKREDYSTYSDSLKIIQF